MIVEIRRVNQQRACSRITFVNRGLRVTKRIDADAGDQVQVALAAGVVNVDAASALQYDRVARVVLKQILLFEILCTGETALAVAMYLSYRRAIRFAYFDSQFEMVGRGFGPAAAFSGGETHRGAKKPGQSPAAGRSPAPHYLTLGHKSREDV